MEHARKSKSNRWQAEEPDAQHDCDCPPHVRRPYIRPPARVKAAARFTPSVEAPQSLWGGWRRGCALERALICRTLEQPCEVVVERGREGLGKFRSFGEREGCADQH